MARSSRDAPLPAEAAARAPAGGRRRRRPAAANELLGARIGQAGDSDRIRSGGLLVVRRVPVAEVNSGAGFLRTVARRRASLTRNELIFVESTMNTVWPPRCGRHDPVFAVGADRPVRLIQPPREHDLLGEDRVEELGVGRSPSRSWRPRRAAGARRNGRREGRRTVRPHARSGRSATGRHPVAAGRPAGMGIAVICERKGGGALVGSPTSADAQGLGDSGPAAEDTWSIVSDRSEHEHLAPRSRRSAAGEVEDHDDLAPDERVAFG